MTTTQDAPRRTSDHVPAPVEVTFVDHKAYVSHVRGHEVRLDQPPEAGGADSGPSPTEIFVVSLASCVAYYAGQFLARHDVTRDGLAVHADYRMATDGPARVGAIHLRVAVPADMPERLVPRLRAVVSHCTVHNTLRRPPEVDLEIDGRPALRPE